jgi:cellulose synthase (UDP-forming)
MTAATTDPRLDPPRWNAAAPRALTRWRVRAIGAVSVLLSVVYFAWLLTPSRVGNPLLYALLVVAEIFNAAQALGFWWTVAGDRAPRPVAVAPPDLDVDVLIPVYGEPLDVVEPTITAAVGLRGARVHVFVLDDGGDPQIEAAARRHGARYVRRPERTGAKAGNINHALRLATSPYVAVFDCDHVPDERFLEATLGQLVADRRVAFVQTPQYYANTDNPIAAAAWSQQALFFGTIARGKAANGSMICCGTNMVFRRAALDEAGGFPEGSVTEDFELSVQLHERGWRSVYVPEVLASGLGPEDLSSYVSQQHRWARGCVGGLRAILRASLPWRVRLQYLLSAGFFLSGWTVLVYMSLPVIRILTGAQPLASASADQFLLHFAPYYGASLLAVAVAGAGSYSFAAFSLGFSIFWVHVKASLAALTGRRGRFVVTPKRGNRGVQLRPALPALAAMAVLAGAAVTGLARSTSPATLNNVAFAGMHVAVLGAGVRHAFTRRASAADATREDERGVEVAA